VTIGAYASLVRRNRNFRLVWTSQIISEIGDWFYSVAVLSFVIQTTGSAKSMAFAFVMQVLPQVVTSPFAGMLNDRISRRSIMIGTDWCRAAIVLSMLLVRGPEMIWLLYILLFLETVMWALFEPARTASIPNITEGEDVAVANALSSATWAVAFALGSGLGGIVQAYFGRQSVFVIDSLSFMVSALLLSRTRFHEPHTVGQSPLSWRDLWNHTGIVDGFRYAGQDRARMYTLFVKAGLGLMGVNWVALPLLGDREFQVQLPGVSASDAGTLGMGFLLSARGAGAMIGALAGSAWAGVNLERLRRNIGYGFILGAAGYLLLSMAPNFLVAVLCVILAHAGGSITWTSSTTLLQKITADRYRGRVFSSEYAMSMTVLSLVTFACGAAIDAGWRVRHVCAVAGASILVPAILWAIVCRGAVAVVPVSSSGTDQ
jgi:MFS family permease